MEARWVALAGGVVIESIAGSPYAFGVWEPALKAQLNYTQAEIETVGSVGNFGQYTGELSLSRHQSTVFLDLLSTTRSIFRRSCLRCFWATGYWYRWRNAVGSW